MCVCKLLRFPCVNQFIYLLSLYVLKSELQRQCGVIFIYCYGRFCFLFQPKRSILYVFMAAAAAECKHNKLCAIKFTQQCALAHTHTSTHAEIRMIVATFAVFSYQKIHMYEHTNTHTHIAMLKDIHKYKHHDDSCNVRFPTEVTYSMGIYSQFTYQANNTHSQFILSFVQLIFILYLLEQCPSVTRVTTVHT